MKALEIQIQNKEQADKELIYAFKAAQAGRKIKPIKGTYFASLEVVRNLLTPKRMELMRLIKHKQPKSLYELAKLAGRDYRNVHEDLQVLKDYGLVKMSKSKPVKRLHTLIVKVPFQEITIHAGI